MSQLFRPLPCLFVLAALAGTSTVALAARHKEPAHEKKALAASSGKQERKASLKKEEKKGRREHTAKHHRKSHEDERSVEKETPRFTGDLGAVKDAIDLARRARTNDATDTEKTITDPAAQKLAEWFVLRHPESVAPFSRYAAFIAANPDWPGVLLMRRRAEARLWQEKADAATVHTFTNDRPVTAKGRFALVREAFRSDELSERAEEEAIDAFSDLLGREDYQARMDKRIGAKDLGAAMRAAHHLGDDAVSIVKACSAVKGGEDKAADRLDSVARDARSDLGYVLCRVQLLMRKDRIADASRLVLAAPRQTMALQDTDEWWRLRRILARKLLDVHDYQGAYEIVSTAALPASENYRADSRFMPGWIALRYLGDAKTAQMHFARLDEGCANPITLARASYWRGRAAEALGDKGA